MTRELIKELREWVAVYDRRGAIVMAGGTPPEIHFSDRLRDTLNDAAETLTTIRNQALDDAIKAMDDERHELEVAEIAKSREKNSGVLYNPEQNLWKLAAAIIRELKAPVSDYEAAQNGRGLL